MTAPSITVWAPRVKPGRIRRLYRLNALGIYGEELLHEAGWGLHDRCLDALVVYRAMHGEVPCPSCGQIVPRPARLASRSGPSRPPASFHCDHCGRELTRQACREVLRNHPRCFDCLCPLTWDYEGNVLSCRRCGREWTWPKYRQSIKGRVWLPCPHCRRKVRLPGPEPSRGGTPPPVAEVECPKCGSGAAHADGKLSCPSCGYEVAWRTYRKRQKRRVERLACASCGHAFTWQSWRKGYAGENLLTGNAAPLRQFAARWRRCKTAQQQMLAIDRLLHAVHGRGPLGPNLIRGTEESVRRLLDELAEARDAG